MSKCDDSTVRSVKWHLLSPNYPFHDSDFLPIREVVKQSRKPLRESVIVIDLTLILSGPGFLRRFPNPVPPGTAVPQWALVAISVRSSVGAGPCGNTKLIPLHRATLFGIKVQRNMSAASNETLTLHFTRLINGLFLRRSRDQFRGTNRHARQSRAPTSLLVFHSRTEIHHQVFREQWV